MAAVGVLGVSASSRISVRSCSGPTIWARRPLRKRRGRCVDGVLLGESDVRVDLGGGLPLDYACREPSVAVATDSP